MGGIVIHTLYLDLIRPLTHVAFLTMHCRQYVLSNVLSVEIFQQLVAGTFCSLLRKVYFGQHVNYFESSIFKAPIH